MVLEEEMELDALGPGTGAKFISAVATQAHLFSALMPMLLEIGEWLQSVKEIGHTLTRARIASVWPSGTFRAGSPILGHPGLNVKHLFILNTHSWALSARCSNKLRCLVYLG